MRGQRPFPLYRVEVNVSADRPEVALILDQSGFEAALGEVARSTMPLGVPVGVSGDEVLHAPRQVGLGRTEEKAEVVGHERETQQVPTEPPDRLLQSLEEPLVITLVLEDGSPEVATGHHVMDRAGIFDPQRSGHGLIISHGARPANRKPDMTSRQESLGKEDSWKLETFQMEPCG